MWIQLLAPKTITIKGRPVRVMPGDWADVGRQQAMLWISSGEARAVQGASSAFPGNCGIVVLGATQTSAFEQYKDFLGITYANEVCLPYERNLIIDIGKLPTPRISLLPVGFSLLERWQVAVPLLDYKELACHLPTSDKELKYIERKIRDLRVPAYDTRLLFVARCGDTQRLIRQWAKERAVIEDNRLSFLAAVYELKPVICALPITWTGKA